MITKVTKDNKGLYRALFEKASEAYFGNPDEIQSLDDYFACLKTLSNIHPIYTVLPLDEPVFSIDTNTRKITVPSEFSKNGISVQGDEVSEILYFSVDRYTDSMDLARKDVNIAIQWETAPDAKGRTVQGISKEWIRDITSLKQEGKVLFGWAINSELTKNPGAIKFSVRFYHFNEEQKLDFSLNTLTASAAINPSIDYQFDENGQSSVQIIDSSNLIKNRLVDSEPPVEAVKPAMPYFLVGYNFPAEGHTDEFGVVDVFKTTADGVEYLSVDLKPGAAIGDGTYEPDYYTFEVQATSEDGGVISYEWYRTELGSTVPDALDTMNDGVEIVYVPTDDEVYTAEYPYYREVINAETGLPGYELVSVIGLIGQTIELEDKEKLLEKRQRYTAHYTGDYKVIAVNRNGVGVSKLDSNHIRIPGPDTESFTLVWPEGQEHSYLVGENGVKGTITLSATADTEQYKDNVVYTWTKLSTGEKTIFGPVDKNTISEFEITVPANERLMYSENFKVEAYATRNGDNTPILEEVFRVTDEAHPVTIRTIGDRVRVEVDEVGTLGVETTRNVASDEITYQWYQYTHNTEDEDPKIEGATSDVLKFCVNADIAAEKGVLWLGQATYYCVATNTVNGSTATSQSGLIDIIQY